MGQVIGISEKDALKQLRDTIRELQNLREEWEKSEELLEKSNLELRDKGEQIIRLQEKVVELKKERIVVQIGEEWKAKLANVRDLKSTIQKEEDNLKKESIRLQEQKDMLSLIDDQIKSRIKSTLAKISKTKTGFDKLDSLDDIRDSLDDIRLLGMETKIRGGGDQILSVRKLCSHPIVKAISTKKNIEESFTDSTKVVTVHKEKSEQIIDGCEMLKLHGALLESDVLEVLNFPDNCPDPVSMFIQFTTEYANPNLFEYKVLFKSDNNWEAIPANSQEGYIHFQLRHMKHFFVISTEKWQPYCWSTAGLYYKSADVKDVSVTFPPCDTGRKCEIEIQVLPPNPVEVKESNDPNYVTDIVRVSPRLWVNHDYWPKLQKSITVTLPLPQAPSNGDDTELCLLEWTERDEVCISSTKLHVKGTVCEFEVNAFSGKSLAILKRRRETKQWMSDINEHYLYRRGLPKECNILIFSDRSAVNTLQVEIAESTRVEYLLELNSKQKLVQIQNTMSKTIPIRYGEIIKVRALGSIRIPLHYKEEYRKIIFTAKEKDNHLRFDVKIINANTLAVLDFRLGKTQVHVCPFEAHEWLRQPRKQSYLEQEVENGKAISERSLAALSKRIPVRDARILAIELGILNNEVEDLTSRGYRGLELTLEVLLLWRNKCDADPNLMVNKLVNALQSLSFKNLASKLMMASQENRYLTHEDFAE